MTLVNCSRCSKRSCYHLVRISFTHCSLKRYVTPRCAQMAVVVPRVVGVGAAGRTDRILSLVWSSAAPNLSLLHVQEVWTGSCWFLWTDPPHLFWNTESIWKVCQLYWILDFMFQLNAPFLYYIYHIPLHVSRNFMLTIGRIHCIHTVSGSLYVTQRTRCCMYTMNPPDDEHKVARNI